MNLHLQNRVALLVGGCGSIGAAVEATLLAEGAVVVIADRAAAIAARSTPGGIAVDVVDEASVRAAIQQTVATHGRIDIVVYLVGVYHAQPLVELAADEWDRMLDINLKGAFLVFREVLPIMQTAGFGRIIGLASLAGLLGGVIAGAHYAASKAGLLSLVKSLARQARPADRPHVDITVNAVSPGPVESAMTANWPAADRARMIANIPVGRFAQPQEIADVIALLASPRSGFVHGARWDVNGGAFMT